MDLLALVQELALMHDYYAFNISQFDNKTTVTLIDQRLLRRRQVKHFSDNNIRVIINKLRHYFCC